MDLPVFIFIICSAKASKHQLAVCYERRLITSNHFGYQVFSKLLFLKNKSIERNSMHE